MPPPERQPDTDESGNASDLLELVYDELRLLARSQLRRGVRGGSIQTTALVHEAWLKLRGDQPGRRLGRQHFMALAATAMRHVLANHAHDRRAAKRGGNWRKISLSEGVGTTTDGTDLVMVSDTLEELWVLNDRHGRLAELRLLSGLNMQECSDVMGVSLSTTERDWRQVRAWFGARMGRSG